MMYKVYNNPKLADNKYLSNNMIDESLMIKFGLRFFEQILVVLNISYLIGMLWLILCEAVEDFILDVDYMEVGDEYPDHYINAFGLTSMGRS
jgi:hypothetical protein